MRHLQCRKVSRQRDPCVAGISTASIPVYEESLNRASGVLILHVGTKIGPTDQQVNGFVVVILRNDPIQGNKGARRRCPIIIPDIRVQRVLADSRGASRHQIVLTRLLKGPVIGEDRTATLCGLLSGGGDNDNIMTSFDEDPIKFANVCRAEAIVIIHQDVQGRSGDHTGRQSGSNEDLGPHDENEMRCYTLLHR